MLTGRIAITIVYVIFERLVAAGTCSTVRSRLWVCLGPRGIHHSFHLEHEIVGACTSYVYILVRNRGVFVYRLPKSACNSSHYRNTSTLRDSSASDVAVNLPRETDGRALSTNRVGICLILDF